MASTKINETYISLKVRKNGKLYVDYAGQTTDMLNMLATVLEDSPILAHLFEHALGMVVAKKIEDAIINEKMQRKGDHEKIN